MEINYLQSCIGDFTDLPGIEDLPVLMVEGLVQPQRRLRRRHVDKSISHVAFVANFNHTTHN